MCSVKFKRVFECFLALVIVLGLPAATALAACPGCGAALDNTVGRGFNMSILFMMGMPFFVFGTLLVGIVLIVRKMNNKPKEETH